MATNNDVHACILKDSISLIEATVRIAQQPKYIIRGRLTFLKVWSGKDGWAVVISVKMPEDWYQTEGDRNFPVTQGSIAITIPELIARRMMLMTKKAKATPNP